MLNLLSQIQPRAASRNDDEPFYIPVSLREALLEDLREARISHTGINESIGDLCEVEAKTVYSWRRTSHAWTLDQIKAWSW